jgi:hypothetical protein
VGRCQEPGLITPAKMLIIPATDIDKAHADRAQDRDPPDPEGERIRREKHTATNWYVWGNEVADEISAAAE